MLFQNRQTAGLFDPRKENMMWPEPNDDPNIPYNWGLNGYAETCEKPLVSSQSAQSSKQLFVRPNEEADKVASSNTNAVYRNVAFTFVAGGFGAYQSYSDNESNMEILKSGLIYGASGFAVSYLIGKIL